MKRLTSFLLVLIFCLTSIFPSALASSSVRDTFLEQELAMDLKNLGLFKGVSDTDFALSRAPTRTEAVVMLIRALGKEDEALSGNWANPFTDVASWADKYVGYAYEKGLANGISSTTFGTGSASACTYLTFVLRSLGYSDVDGADFYWDEPFSLAKSLGLLPDKVQIVDFLRADVVTISYTALSVEVKGTSQSLADKLISAGVFTKDSYNKYYDANAINSVETTTSLSSEEIYARCSPAVFYLETYNSKGAVMGWASGFFIDNKGTAVTNYHSIEGAYSAKITTSDTNTVYGVLGVYDYDKDVDWAILKIDGSGFSYLDLGSSSSVIGGAVAYALGCPLGLKNTITEGIISNPKRQIDDSGITYIQTSAAISVGSSGGALLNKYGKAIGITTASSVTGQNINLALPVDCINGYSAESYQTLLSLTVNSKSKLSSYSGYPEIPDCGAYYGLKPYKSDSASSVATYYYSLDTLTSLGAWTNETKYPQYLNLLEEWGFEFSNSFSIGSSTYWQFSYSSDTTSYIVLVGITTVNSIRCLSVQIISA